MVCAAGTLEVFFAAAVFLAGAGAGACTGVSCATFSIFGFTVLAAAGAFLAGVFLAGVSLAGAELTGAVVVAVAILVSALAALVFFAVAMGNSLITVRVALLALDQRRSEACRRVISLQPV